MKKYAKRILQWYAVVFMELFLVCSPWCSALVADTEISSDLPSIIFTEILTGTKTSGTQEFIELYNTTDQPIDLTGWQVWYLSAQATNVDKPSSSGVIMLGNGTDSPVIAAHDYYVLSGRSDYLTGLARQFYDGTMAATGGNVRLLMPDETQPCLLDVQDQIGWGNARYAQGAPASAPPSSQSIARLRLEDGSYVDTQNNAADFAVANTPTPAVVNSGKLAVAPVPRQRTPLPNIMINGCTISVPPPAGGSPLEQPGESDVPPVALPDSPGGVAPPTLATPKFPLNDVGLVTPQITELLPNPLAPKTDAADEFIELYNSNATDFDLSGFSLEVGLTTKRRYSFPVGTVLSSQSFMAFFSGTTGLTLSNSGGQARLLDPYGNIVNQTETYGVAKDGQAWALLGSAWSWTTKPTPGSANSNAPATTKKATSPAAASGTKKTSTAKSTATKAKAATKPKAAKSKTSGSVAPKGTVASTVARPLHPAVLAVIAGFALLYGLYEYRHDLANKFHQLRTNRTARRANRAEAKGG